MTPYKDLTKEIFNEEFDVDLENAIALAQYVLFKAMAERVNKVVKESYSLSKEERFDLVIQFSKLFGTPEEEVWETINKVSTLEARSNVFIGNYKDNLKVHPDTGELLFSHRDTSIVVNISEDEIIKRMNEMPKEQFHNSIYEDSDTEPQYLN